MIFLHKNVFCDGGLQPSCRGGSNEGSQHVLLEKYDKLSLNQHCYPFLSGAPLDALAFYSCL